MMGDLNARLGGTRDKRKEDMVMALADHGFEDATRNFDPWRRYRGQGQWTWKMHRKGQKVMSRGDYDLGTSQG